MLKAIAHPERIMILYKLVNGEAGVSELKKTSQAGRSAFSQHLAVLKRNNLVQSRKVSQQVFYSLADRRIEPLIRKLNAL